MSINKPTSLQITDMTTAILSTMAYFDIIDYPLTLLELHKWLWRKKTTVDELLIALENHPYITCTKGFYHLKNRETLVQTRLSRYPITEQKIQILTPYLRYLATLPHVATIMISDSVSIYNATDGSDLDIAIITKPHKIWSTRFWAAFPAQLLGLRPRIHKDGHIDKKNKICLCFYTTTTHLNLKKQCLTEPDIDFMYWIASMLPIYDPNDTYASFITANEWIQSYLPNLTPYQGVDERNISITKNPLAYVPYLFSAERLLKKLQHRLLNHRLRELAETQDTRVVINDHLLKLHMNDRRLDIQKKWCEKMALLIKTA